METALIKIFEVLKFRQHLCNIILINVTTKIETSLLTLTKITNKSFLHENFQNGHTRSRKVGEIVFDI